MLHGLRTGLPDQPDLTSQAIEKCRAIDLATELRCDGWNEDTRDVVWRDATEDEARMRERRQRLVAPSSADMRQDTLVQHALHDLLVHGFASAFDVALEQRRANRARLHQLRGQPHHQWVDRLVGWVLKRIDQKQGIFHRDAVI